MSRRISGPTQSEISRAVKAIKAAGLNVSGVEIDGGKIVVLTSPVGKESSQPDDELERWLEKQRAKERKQGQKKAT